MHFVYDFRSKNKLYHHVHHANIIIAILRQEVKDPGLSASPKVVSSTLQDLGFVRKTLLGSNRANNGLKIVVLISN
jgi:hypothetical protein